MIVLCILVTDMLEVRYSTDYTSESGKIVIATDLDILGLSVSTWNSKFVSYEIWFILYELFRNLVEILKLRVVFDF